MVGVRACGTTPTSPAGSLFISHLHQPNNVVWSIYLFVVWSVVCSRFIIYLFELHEATGVGKKRIASADAESSSTQSTDFDHQYHGPEIKYVS
jgi:hypothetical protein